MWVQYAGSQEDRTESEEVPVKAATERRTRLNGSVGVVDQSRGSEHCNAVVRVGPSTSLRHARSMGTAVQAGSAKRLRGSAEFDDRTVLPIRAVGD